MQEDPVAGVMVTKYLSGNGDVQMQIPSTVALAYLRVGLTATGELKNDPNAVAANAANKGVVA